LAKLGVIDPLDDLIPKEIWDDVYGGVREEMVYTGDGKTYTFPWWTDAFGLIYRPSMLEEAVGTREPPETWDEVIDYAKKINEYYGGEIAGFGGDWPWSHRMFVPIMGTFTDEPFVDPGIFNLGEPSLKALKLLKEVFEVMPDAAAESLGTSKAFQAGGVAMEIYWQTQMLRAFQAGQPKHDVMMAPFPRGDYVSTIFWTAGAIIPTQSQNKEEAVRFMLEGMLDWATVVDTEIGDYKIVPFRSLQKLLEERNMLPDWAPPLLETIEVASPIPCNQYFLTIEQPIYKEEVERMMYEDRSPEETLEAMKTRIMKALEEAE
jgi:ABC-type glycerol-3-phosphate transport system substrate-binding protein